MATSTTRRVLRFGAGAALFGASLAGARAAEIAPFEERVFRWANGADDRLRLPVRAIMQAGTFATVPAVAVVAFLAGRRRLALTVLAAGTAAWYGAKIAKPLGGRDRPRGVLGDDVRIREGIEGDLGWVSGHTCVATTTAFVLAEELPGWTRPSLASIVAITGFGRMYVGAHLPHDIVGGMGLGMMISAITPGPQAS
ncbi:MAG: phosphatase PAP2 family protein [Actinomycetota bacterium]